MSEINPDPHAFPNVFEHPGVGRVQLGAILELEQTKGAIDEAYRSYFPGPGHIARIVGDSVSKRRRHAERHCCQQYSIPHVFSSRVRILRNSALSRVESVRLSPLERVAARARVLRVLAELGLNQ
jgi:hypothetical protein